MTARNSLGTILGAVALVVTAACTPAATRDASPSPAAYASPSPTAPASGDAVDRARQGAESAGEALKEGAEKAGEAIKDAAQAVKENAGPAARQAKEQAKPVMKEAGSVLDATKQQVDVKAALLADKAIDASRIDVDVDRATKTVVLRGTVPTAEQRAAAERIARDKAEGWAVRNELTVMARP